MTAGAYGRHCITFTLRKGSLSYLRLPPHRAADRRCPSGREPHAGAGMPECRMLALHLFGNQQDLPHLPPLRRMMTSRM